MTHVTSSTKTYENRWPSSSSVETLHSRSAAPGTVEGSLTIRPIVASSSSSFGAEISGINWDRPVPEEIVTQVLKS